jgi:hypothetical protein
MWLPTRCSSTVTPRTSWPTASTRTPWPRPPSRTAAPVQSAGLILLPLQVGWLTIPPHLTCLSTPVGTEPACPTLLIQEPIFNTPWQWGSTSPVQKHLTGVDQGKPVFLPIAPPVAHNMPAPSSTSGHEVHSQGSPCTDTLVQSSPAPRCQALSTSPRCQLLSFSLGYPLLSISTR